MRNDVIISNFNVFFPDAKCKMHPVPILGIGTSGSIERIVGIKKMNAL